MKKSTFITILILFFIWLGAIFLNLYPHYLGYINCPHDKFFSKQVSWFDPWDINVYVAAVKDGQQGNFLLPNRYTTKTQSASLIYPLYTSAGLILPQADPFLIFYGLSIITAGLYILSVFTLSQFFLKNTTFASLNTALVIFGGGLGWSLINNFQAADLYQTGFISHSTIQRPHEAIGMSLFLLALYLGFKFQKNQHSSKIILINLSLYLITLVPFYPYYLPIFGLIQCLYWWFLKLKKERLIMLAGVCLVPAGLTLIYWLHLQHTDFSSVTNQFLPNASLFSVILSYGLILLVAGLAYTQSKNRPEQKFLLTWFLSTVLISYFPLGFARFYLRGLWLVLGLICLNWLKQIFDKNKQLAWLIGLILASFIPLSTLTIFSQRLNAAHSNNAWIYLDKSIKTGFNFLEQQSADEVLSSYVIGNYLPAHTNKTVYYGHAIQSPNKKERLDNITRFYQMEMAVAEALNFLKENNINYVFYSSLEQIIGPDLNYPFLQPVFNQDSTVIFNVK